MTYVLLLSSLFSHLQDLRQAACFSLELRAFNQMILYNANCQIHLACQE